MKTNIKSFINTVLVNMRPKRKEPLVNGKTIEESRKEFLYKVDQRQKAINELFEIGRVAIDGDGNVIPWHRYIIGCAQFIIELNGEVSEQSVILPAMDEIINKSVNNICQ